MPSAPSKKIIVTQRFFDDRSRAYLEAHGFTVEVVPLPPGLGDGDLDFETLRQGLAGAVGWIVGHARVTRTLMEALPGLQVIARRGVGYDRVDVEAARELGRVVTIAAGGNDASVADHTIGLMLAVGCRFRESQARMVAGDWSIRSGTDLCEKTVGLVGLGRIGKSVVRRLSGFDTKILVHTRTPDPDYASQAGVQFTDLDQILRQSDYISLHAPLTPQTRFLINAAAIAAMKQGAILINTARGGLVDDAALLEALRSGHLGGAGLDVFVSEGDATYRAVTDALLALPNVVATPHAAASSHEGLARTNLVAARSIVAVLKGETPPPGSIVADGR
ncbi:MULTISPECIES: phosphoglycerate dehydrogenase [unclassified Azospirillum]|uniref:phosphoglycerate dehydrogenase n=1 Tax=unclassified Azospirillum TaxID=2630922 RepID=UPI000B7322CA|nr:MULTISPECIES: phosphoglycerate dehydrogenase [unclassified Azospirillum]SNS73677.1 D-3-phosphoglycerate dehydrogenase [Azospirillum sp. RU38E]SNS91507.1 D-3-phosphoglycerate dehydrogenase [Azospirillum sp. RU37A]